MAIGRRYAFKEGVEELFNGTVLSIPDASVGGTGDAITVTRPNGPVEADGLTLSFPAPGANTGAVTLAYNGGAARALVRSNGDALNANAFDSGAPLLARFDGAGSRWRLVAGGGAISNVLIDPNNYANAQAAAIAALGKNFLVPENLSGANAIELTVGQDVTGVNDAYNKMAGWKIPDTSFVKIVLPEGATTETESIVVTHPNGSQISIDGSADPRVSITNIGAITRSADVFNGTGAQTDFTLSETPVHEGIVAVWVDGEYQYPDGDSTNDYTIVGSTITFNSAPAAGTGNIVVIRGWDVVLSVPDANNYVANRDYAQVRLALGDGDDRPRHTRNVAGCCIKRIDHHCARYGASSSNDCLWVNRHTWRLSAT